MNNKLNTLMAEKVMGWVIGKNEWEWVDKNGDFKAYRKGGVKGRHVMNCPCEVWNPTEDMNQARDCVEKFSKDSRISIRAYYDFRFGEWTVMRNDSKLEYVDADLPRAICEAIGGKE